jgi:hypothetical protein
MCNARRKGGPDAQAARLEAALELQNRERRIHADPVAGPWIGTILLMDQCRLEETGQGRKSNRRGERLSSARRSRRSSLDPPVADDGLLPALVSPGFNGALPHA